MTEAEYTKATKQLKEKAAAGLITFEEYSRQGYLIDEARGATILLEYRSRQQWQEFIKYTLTHWQAMRFAFRFYDEIPDSMKYSFAIEAYIHHGDSIPAVRRAVRTAAKYGKPELPADIAAQETITIYRAGEEPIEKSKCRISWTTDYNVAVFFYSEYMHKHANHLYQGTIRTADIIAYCDDRQEKEVMQYRKVYDIKEITPQACLP